jgi:hypothetical protein
MHCPLDVKSYKEVLDLVITEENEMHFFCLTETTNRSDKRY